MSEVSIWGDSTIFVELCSEIGYLTNDANQVSHSRSQTCCYFNSDRTGVPSTSKTGGIVGIWPPVEIKVLWNFADGIWLISVSIQEAILLELSKCRVINYMYTCLVHSIVHSTVYFLWQAAFVCVALGRGIIAMLLDREVVEYQLQRQFLFAWLQSFWEALLA